MCALIEYLRIFGGPGVPLKDGRVVINGQRCTSVPGMPINDSLQFDWPGNVPCHSRVQNAAGGRYDGRSGVRVRR